jgi:hypothetical protein
LTGCDLILHVHYELLERLGSRHASRWADTARRALKEGMPEHAITPHTSSVFLPKRCAQLGGRIIQQERASHSFQIAYVSRTAVSQMASEFALIDGLVALVHL